jgi:3-hydroxyisobutyrate dehydrogenase-like beta-hydroxyacid dehydrogenase
VEALKMKLGLIGFGQVGSAFAKGLRKEGFPHIVAYDKMQDTQQYGDMIKRRAKEADIELLSDAEQLVKNSDIIICVTSASVAVESAQQILPFIAPNHIYADLNSTSPEVKERIANLIMETEAKFVDGAIMGSISLYGYKSQILVCGDGAEIFAKALSTWGMNIRKIGDKPGQASALKMVRSVWAKGIEALLIESLLAAYEYEILEPVFESVCEMMQEDFATLANMLITTDAIHAQRRAHEMDEVIRTLQHVGTDFTMSQATRNKLQWSANLGLKEDYKGEIPNDFREVLAKLAQKSR